MTSEKSKASKNTADPVLSTENQDLLGTVARTLEGYDIEPGILLDEPQITILPKDLLEISRILKNDPTTKFNLLQCISTVDYEDCLQIVYILFSLTHFHSIVIKVSVSSENPTVSSVSQIWRGAEWYERESHDLFGVHFENHPDLSPLLLYAGFEGFPGRKAFPFHEYEEF